MDLYLIDGGANRSTRRKTPTTSPFCVLTSGDWSRLKNDGLSAMFVRPGLEETAAGIPINTSTISCGQREAVQTCGSLIGDREGRWGGRNSLGRQGKKGRDVMKWISTPPYCLLARNIVHTHTHTHTHTDTHTARSNNTRQPVKYVLIPSSEWSS